MVGRLIGAVVASIVVQAIVDLALDPRAPFVFEPVIDNELNGIAGVEPDWRALESCRRLRRQGGHFGRGTRPQAVESDTPDRPRPARVVSNLGKARDVARGIAAGDDQWQFLEQISEGFQGGSVSHRYTNDNIR